MNIDSIIDVHCHLFNVKYALKEVAAITWNMARSKYPHTLPPNLLKKRGIEKKSSEKPGLTEILEEAGDLISYVARLVKVCKRDCKSNHSYMQKEFRLSSLGCNKNIIAVPLMMDIYYALDDNKHDLQSITKRSAGEFGESVFDIGPDEIDDFQDHLEILKSKVMEQLFTNDTNRAKISSLGSSKVIEDSECTLDSIFNSIEEEFLKSPPRMRATNQYHGVEMSPGYKDHLEALEKLHAQMKGSIYPFLAVDPRRRGIMKLITSKVNKKDGPFYGIKLYPPLGYLPSDPKLVPIFDYCQENHIPITVHCSEGGVKNLKKKNYVHSTEDNYPREINKGDKSAFYAHPVNWKPVLNKWKDLRLNLAHFGGSVQYSTDPGRKWMNTIKEILTDKNYKHVYTDLSYYVKTGSMDEILANNQDIKEKIMFGTDYIMIMLEKELGGLKNYYNNFRNIDKAFLYENAKRFLGLDTL